MISRRTLLWSLLGGGGLLLLLAGGGFYLSWRDYLDYSPAMTIDTVLPRGTGVVQTGELLESLGVVSSSRWFVFHYWLSREGAMQAGEYRFEKGDAPGRVLQRLVRGEVLQHRLVIPEGFTLREVSREMTAQGLANAATLLADPALVNQLGVAATTLEGWLFPDTYFFQKGITTLDLVRRMVDRSRRILMQEWEGREKGFPLSPYQALILASIIEKETGVAHERKQISGVFHNRLKRKMRLQSDPTVIYGIADFNGDLTRKDLTRPTPFNTYTNEGLPPSPIANPGQASIHAAFHPERTEELYFVATGDGGHVFSKTLAEHQRHVSQYQKRRKEAGGSEKSP